MRWSLSRASSIASRYVDSATAQRSVVAWSRAIRPSTNGSAPTAARSRAIFSACSISERPTSVSRRKIGPSVSHGSSRRSSRSSGAPSTSVIASWIASAPLAPSPPRIRAMPSVVTAMNRALTEGCSGSVATARLATASISVGLPAWKHAIAASQSIATARSGSARVGRRGEDRVASHHRTAPRRDLTGKAIDADDHRRVGRALARGVEQLAGAARPVRRAMRSRPRSGAGARGARGRPRAGPARSNAAAAVAYALRSRARTPACSSAADAASSGPIAADARCQARRSTSRSGSAAASARCASRRSCAGASA